MTGINKQTDTGRLQNKRYSVRHKILTDGAETGGKMRFFLLTGHTGGTEITHDFPQRCRFKAEPTKNYIVRYTISYPLNIYTHVTWTDEKNRLDQRIERNIIERKRAHVRRLYTNTSAMEPLEPLAMEHMFQTQYKGAGHHNFVPIVFQLIYNTTPQNKRMKRIF